MKYAVLTGCFAAAAAIAFAGAAANGAVDVYTDEASFFAAGDVESTETFGSYAAMEVLGVGSCQVDQVIYTASNPASIWRTSDAGYANRLFGTPAFIDDWDTLTFGPGNHTTAIGFALHMMALYPLMVDVETTAGQILTEQVPGGWDNYRGYVASEGIVSVTIRDYPSDGHLPNFYLDDVSRGQIVPEPATLSLLGLASLIALRRRRW